MSELRVTTLQHEAAAASNITLASNGNVGIGTSSPANYRLHVEGENNLGTVYIHGGTGASWGLEIGSHSQSLESDLVLTGNAVIGSQASLSNVAQGTGYFRWMTGGTSHKTGTDGATERMRIDSEGRVTMPYQPAFKAHVSGSPSHVNATAIPFSATSLNIGSYFNTANYTFTAPVAGVYVFGGMFRVDVVATYVHLSVAINGALSKQNLELLGLSTGNGSGFTAAPFAYLRYLSAGDAVSFLGYHSVGGTQSLNEQSFLYGYLQS